MQEAGNKHSAGAFAAEFFSWVKDLVIVLLVLLFINLYFFRLSGVDGTSMVPTLHDRDLVLARLVGYSEPERGDIILLTTGAYPNKSLVKRVIGVAGDEVSLSMDGVLSINGEEQYEPYLREKIRRLGNIAYPFTVPEGRVFVMGDNRNGSDDSRNSDIGAIPLEDIIGKVVFRLWPPGSFGRMGG